MAMPLTRPDSSYAQDRRTRECGNGSPACRYAPDDGPDNPLGLCTGCLATYREHLELPPPVVCATCERTPIVLESGRLWHPAGAMCFVCGLTTGGTVATPENRAKARASMRARLGALFVAGDRGAEWAALLARCPADIREAIERRLARVAPA
jgi:hypothetical protein